jgi:nitroreductase
MTISGIMARKSVRNYTGEALREADSAKLREFIGGLEGMAGVFGNRARLALLESGGERDRLGTYGVIRGARWFLAVACSAGPHDLEDAGYLFEKAILFATELGLGTVILGGTFSRGGFAKAMRLREGETIPVVSPVGYEGGKKSLLGRVIKSNAGNRKPGGELFFEGGFARPMDAGGEYADVLEAVRQAPSARNMQPWRVVREGEKAFHFYSAGVMDMNRIDMGIALCHFEIAAREKGLPGRFEVLRRGNEGEKKYLASWLIDR